MFTGQAHPARRRLRVGADSMAGGAAGSIGGVNDDEGDEAMIRWAAPAACPERDVIEVEQREFCS